MIKGKEGMVFEASPPRFEAALSQERILRVRTDRCALGCETRRKNHRNKTAKLAFVDEFDAFSIYACSELVKDVHSEHAWCVLE
jgi:hypothetical protein